MKKYVCPNGHKPDVVLYTEGGETEEIRRKTSCRISD